MPTDNVGPPDQSQNTTNPTTDPADNSPPVTTPMTDLTPSYPDARIKSLNELRTRFPEIYNEWLKSLGMEIVNKMRKDEETRKKHAKENQK
jgi:hypothetical protein